MRIINAIRLPSAPVDADDWDLSRVLQRLSSIPAEVAELAHSVDNRDFTDIGFSGVDQIASILNSTSGHLGEVARSAVNLARELDRANKITRHLASAQQVLADVPTGLLEFADQLAREFDIRELWHGYTTAKAMSDFLHALNEISESASVLAGPAAWMKSLTPATLLASLIVLRWPSILQILIMLSHVASIALAAPSSKS